MKPPRLLQWLRTSSRRLMKSRGMSNTGKTLFKDKVENFSRMSLRLQPVIGLDGRFFRGLKRGRRRAPALKLFQSKNGTVLSFP